MAAQVAQRLWPANRPWALYQIDAESLLADFTCEEEDLFTQDDDLDVTIVNIKDGAVCRNLKCTSLEKVLQYIQVPRLSSNERISQLTPTRHREKNAQKP
jgi:hypothetical protein